MRGHGRSDMPKRIEGYSSKLYADDFAAVCKHFGLKAPVYVGWYVFTTFSICQGVDCPLSILGASEVSLFMTWNAPLAY